ncbi:MAG: hypothetical protein QXT45_01925 [Candidatus Bilamarchaeaceae archaeon]
MKRLFLLLLVLGAVWSADVSVSANYDDMPAHTSFYFSTSQRFTADMSCAVQGKVLSGTPCDGTAIVCVGTNMTLTPILSGRWAVGSSLNILAPYYPPCDRCPNMQDYTAKSEENVKWLSNSMFDSYSVDTGGYATGITYLGNPGISLYNELGTFHAQSTDYLIYLDQPQPNSSKKGYGNVFCKGRWEVRIGPRGDGGEMSTPPSSSYTEHFTTEGDRIIHVLLSNVKCFAAFVKHPTDVDNPSSFNLNFFGYNAPSIPNVIEESTIRVVNIQPGLDITGVRAERSSGSTYLLRITVRNTGDVREQVTAVHPISGSAHPAGGLDCMLYGWFCSGDNGFNEYINPGDSHDLYVTYSGTLSGDIFRLDYESPDPTCSASTTWNTTVNIPPGGGITRCEIQPMGLALTPYEIHEWSVTCYNAIGAVVPCVGDDWSFDRINGGFISKSSRNAIGYVTETSCLLPTPACADYITYRTGSVMCAGRITSYPPEDSRDPNSFVCDLTPDSANLNVGDSQDFTVNCSMEGTPVSPTRADYDTVNGLDGSLTGETTRGVTFTATTESEGDVQVIAWYTSPFDPTLRGAIDWSHVIVGNITNQTTNETAQENETPSEGVLCVINPSVISPAYPSMSGTVVIKCGPSGNETCDGVSWSAESATVSGDNYGAVYTVRSDARPGTGRIMATIDTDPHHEGPEGNCEAVLRIQEPECIIIS